MNLKETFEFLNSDLWLNYTQQRYLTPIEIKHRLRQQGTKAGEWTEIEKQITATRKAGAITLFIESIKPKFWFYPADVIQRKVHEIDTLGKSLYAQINHHAAFKADFLLDSAIEEAITSAIYEGANSTRAQAEQLIASGERPKNKDEWMLVNNVRAMKWIKENRSSALSKASILKIHQIVTENTLEGDDANFSGKVRDGKVFVGPHEGIPYGHVESALNEMLTLVTGNPRYLHPLLKGILLHYFVAYIHPFFDGNGRTARALFYLKAMRNELSYVELLSVSAYLKEHGPQYEKAFVKVVENDHDLTYFIDFSLDLIHAALTEVARKVSFLLKLNSLQEELGLSKHQVGFIQRMALHKFRAIDADEYAKQILKSREFARQELKRLTDLDLVFETKVGKRLVYKINSAKLKSLVSKMSD